MALEDAQLLTVHIEQDADVFTVRPVGDLDAATADVLRTALNAVQPAGRVTIDLTDVPFVDSAGLGALLSGIRRLGTGADVMLCNPRPPVLRLLRMTGVDGVVRVLAAERDESDAM